MTEQEILALTEEDVQKLIKLRMMEEGINNGSAKRLKRLKALRKSDI